MAAPAVLDPSQFSLSLMGVAVSGYAPGTFITIAYDEDETDEMVGADGEIVVMRSKNRKGTLTLTLTATAAANDQFNAAAELFRAGAPGGVGSMLCKNLNGRDVSSAESAWVKTRPPMSFSKAASDMTRQWVFSVNPLALGLGGSY